MNYFSRREKSESIIQNDNILNRINTVSQPDTWRAAVECAWIFYIFLFKHLFWQPALLSADIMTHKCIKKNKKNNLAPVTDSLLFPVRLPIWCSGATFSGLNPGILSYVVSLASLLTGLVKYLVRFKCPTFSRRRIYLFDWCQRVAAACLHTQTQQSLIAIMMKNPTLTDFSWWPHVIWPWGRSESSIWPDSKLFLPFLES